MAKRGGRSPARPSFPSLPNYFRRSRPQPRFRRTRVPTSGSHHSFPPKLGFLGLVLTKRMKKELRKGKPKGKGKGKGKPKSKHTRARANPIASSPDRALGISLPVDLTSSVSSTTPGNASPSPLPDHKSSPRYGMITTIAACEAGWSNRVLYHSSTVLIPYSSSTKYII